MRQRAKKVQKNRPDIVFVFGTRLREERLRRGISQMELSAKSTVDLSYLGRIERCEAEAGLDVASRLADALGLQLGVMLMDQSQQNSLSALRKQVTEGFNQLIQIADASTLQTLVQVQNSLHLSLRRRE